MAEVSESYQDSYQAQSDLSNTYYQASVDAYLAGDDMAAYELNQASIQWDSSADTAWTASNSVWTDMATTTTETTYDVTAGYTDTSAYDASAYEVPAYDASAYEVPAVDTSWTATTDTSWSATDTSSYDSSYDSGI